MVKYHHLLPGFAEDKIIGYRFDGVSPPFIELSELGVRPDLLEIRNEPICMSYGPNNQDVDEEITDAMNKVGGMGSKS